MAQLRLAVLVAAAHRLPIARGAAAGLCVDRHPPHRLRSRTFALFGPEDLAGDGAGLAADALIEIEYPRQLALGVRLLALGGHCSPPYFTRASAGSFSTSTPTPLSTGTGCQCQGRYFRCP